jgi:hypothetical protein
MNVGLFMRCRRSAIQVLLIAVYQMHTQYRPVKQGGASNPAAHMMLFGGSDTGGASGGSIIGCATYVPDEIGWSEWQDLNLRPPRPERSAPRCRLLQEVIGGSNSLDAFLPRYLGTKNGLGVACANFSYKTLK